ncbi:trehalose-6-phosphate phosphatase [Sideroxyarcus emersonii]|uniref:Trehalose 6-phosphate phosphatase n=1 Tax=Sideroxyarcus emersonii TaxID=2764705 RepID=A0AAN2BZT2_9PROT|nr:trehalose-phosphatase [Sideroxyarcus emersonii]BCK88448.1 trehalose-6-phosphate phosphatase [Sideroxyarcus emersonii]
MRIHLPPAASISWSYFLDVDGTLIDIADTPDAACIDASLLDLIARLYRASGGAVALVSGRALSDLENRLGALRLPLAGQHGLERRDAAGRLWIHAAPPAAKHAIKQALAPALARHPGLLLEDKGLTLALHYRQAPHLAAYARRSMVRLANDANAGLEVQFGKRVAEVKPSGIDKGTAISEYLAESPFRGRRPVFIGDDLNDEHGFAEVNRLDGISIKVGHGSSCARYRLPDVTAARQWLDNALQEVT